MSRRLFSKMRTGVYLRYIAIRKRWVMQRYRILILPFLHSHDKALTQAVLCGNAHNAEVLLTRGANANILLPGGSPLLFHAVAQGWLNIAQLLIRFGADVNATHVVTRNTVLSEAAYKGNMNAIELLLSHSADVNSADIAGTTPLMRAVMNKQVEAVRTLLDAGARKDMRSMAGSTAPLLAKALKHTQIAAMFGIQITPVPADPASEKLLRPATKPEDIHEQK